MSASWFPRRGLACFSFRMESRAVLRLRSLKNHTVQHTPLGQTSAQITEVLGLVTQALSYLPITNSDHN